MIISHRHRFVFFHNPKAGGTSIRAAIEGFNDIGFGLWGEDPAQTGGQRLDRAHLGIDEFAALYPDLWARVRDYGMFCLCRDPRARFLSSVSEYSKKFGRQDMRFAGPEEARDILMRALDRLEPFGTAEAVVPERELTHFRPQHLYWRSEHHPVTVRSFPTDGIGGLFAALSERTGTEVALRREKAATAYRLPAPLKRLQGTRGLRRAVAALPVLGPLADRGKAALKARYATGPGRALALSAQDEARIDAFLRRFYARDYATWPGPPAEAP